MSRVRSRWGAIQWANGQISREPRWSISERLKAGQVELINRKPLRVRVIENLFLNELRAVSGRRMEGTTREVFNAPTILTTKKVQRIVPTYQVTSPNQRVRTSNREVITDQELEFRAYKQAYLDERNCATQEASEAV